MKNKNLFLGLIALIAITLFSCTDDAVDFDLNNNQDVFETVVVNLELVLQGVIDEDSKSSSLKSASVSSLDSLEVTMLYKKNGAWIKVAKANFSDTVNLVDFCNPMTVEFYPPIRFGYILRAECRFVFRGLDYIGNNTYYGIVEADLRDVIDETTLVVPMVETKSYFGLNVLELTASSYRYVFDYLATVREIDYDACLTTIPPIDGTQVPAYYFGTENLVNGQLVVEGENVTLNGEVVDYTDYIDMLEYWGSSAPEVNLTVTAYDGTTELWTNSVNKNWLEFGFNHYVRVANVTSVSTTFDLIDNEDVVEDWEIQEEEGMPSIFEGMIGYWDLQNDALDSHGDNNDIEVQGIIFDGSSVSFDGNSYMAFKNEQIREIGANDLTINLWFKPNSDSHGLVFSKRQHSYYLNNDLYYCAMIECVINYRALRLEILENTVGNSYVNGSYLQSSTTIEDDGEIHFVSIIREGDEWKLMLDGNLEASATISGDMSGTVSWPLTKPYIMLGKTSPYPHTFTGIQKYLSIYNHALTQEEITYLYNEGQGRSYSEL